MAESDVMDPAFWTKKAGPLPVWAWVGIAGGGIGFFYLRKKNTVQAPTAADVAGSSDTGFGTTTQGVGGQSATVNGGTTTVTTAPADNQSWSVKAQNMLIAQGFDPATVALALSNYLGGNNLTPQQQAIVSEALRDAGPTPEPVPPPVTAAPTPTPITPTSPTPTSTYSPAQWSAGQNVAGQGTPGVGIPWTDLAIKALSSNTRYNPVNVSKMASAMKAKNPTVAKDFPIAVPLSRVKNPPGFIVPKVVGLN
jgi:hypothetical protein